MSPPPPPNSENSTEADVRQQLDQNENPTNGSPETVAVAWRLGDQVAVSDDELAAPSMEPPPPPPVPTPPGSVVPVVGDQKTDRSEKGQQQQQQDFRKQSGGSSQEPTNKKKPAIKIPAKQGTLNSLSVPEANSNRQLCTLERNKDQSGGCSTERKGSVVSFSETCDLYEIDLEKGERDKEFVRSKPAFCNSIRYYVMLLALLSPFVTTYSKTIINFAITDMIDPEFVEKKDSVNSSNIDGNNSAIVRIEPYFDRDQSCPVQDDNERDRLIHENRDDIKRAQSGGEKFKWDSAYQGLLKSAYSWGHAPFQVPGSRMSEYYGSHRVMSVSSMLIAICCLLAPYLAATHYSLFFMDLFFLGVLGSFMTPALITLFSNWLTPSEKTITLTFYLVASRLGYALSSILCGELIHAHISWRYVFFSAGTASLIFSSIFFVCARSRPQDHPLISQLELDYLAKKNILVREGLAQKKRDEEEKKRKKYNQSEIVEECELKTFNLENGFKKNLQPHTGKINQQENDSVESVSHYSSNCSTLESTATQQTSASKKDKLKKRAPWKAIFTNAPVWAFVITKFCVKLAGDTVQTELPTYLKRVMHYDSDANGLINGSMYAIFCCGCFLVGGLAKTVNKLRPFGLSKTALRKIFQSIASFGVSISLLGIAFSVCEHTSTSVFLMLMFFLTTFSTGGEAQIPFDITERYSGTIHALGSSLAISGAIEPLIVGFFLKKHEADRERWRIVWLVASSIAATGGLVFLIFGEASVQSFDSIGAGEENQETNKSDNVSVWSAGEQKQEARKVSAANGVDSEASEKDYDQIPYVAVEKGKTELKEGGPI